MSRLFDWLDTSDIALAVMIGVALLAAVLVIWDEVRTRNRRRTDRAERARWARQQVNSRIERANRDDRRAAK